MLGALPLTMLALALLRWWALEMALHALLLRYMVLTAMAVVVAWKQGLETRTAPPPQAGRQTRLSGP
jgi:hypothetical protein